MLKWTDMDRLVAYLKASAGEQVECPACDRICDIYGESFMDVQIWCPHCKQGAKSGWGKKCAAS